MTFETDYPHADGTWPHSRAVAEKLLAGLPDDVVHKIVRDNAQRMLGIAVTRATTLDRSPDVQEWRP